MVFLVLGIRHVPGLAHERLFPRKMCGHERVNFGNAPDDAGALLAGRHRVMQGVNQRNQCAVLAVDLLDAEIELAVPFDQAHRWCRPCATIFQRVCAD